MIQRNFHPSNGRERIHYKVQGNREIKTKSNLVFDLESGNMYCGTSQLVLFFSSVEEHKCSV